MDSKNTRLDWLLRQIQLVDPPYRESEGGQQLYREICKLVLEGQLYTQLWSEPLLNQLEQLFQTEKPDEKLFEAELEEIHKRTIVVREVNDCFFGIVDLDTTSKDLCELLAKFDRPPRDFCNRLDISGRLQHIRTHDGCTSEKVEWFLEFLKDDLGLDLITKESIKGCLASLKTRESIGKINALMVKGSAKAIALSLHIKLQAGTGQVCCQIKGSEEFKDAVGRAQLAMRERGYVGGAEDILYTLDLTDAHYQGSSLALAAAVGIYDVKQSLATDPYTAFTGDINLDGQEWAIKPVSGVPQKIAAAKRAGCRRVFIPRFNCTEIASQPGVTIYGVESLTELFIQLRPNQPLPPTGSLQGRKITSLQQHCISHGWDLSPPQPIQGGISIQYRTPEDSSSKSSNL